MNQNSHVMLKEQKREQGNKVLRIGIMLDAMEVPAWVHKILLDIGNAPFLKLELIILNTPTQPHPSAATVVEKLASKLKSFHKAGLYYRYASHDYRRYKADKDAFAPVDISNSFANTATLRVKPIQKKFTDWFNEDDISVIKRAELDVLIRFGFRIIKGEILNCARYGVWSYHHGDNREYRGGPALFWELYEKNPVSGIMLQVLSEQLDAGKVLYRSISATVPESLYLNRNATYWKGTEFVMRRLSDLHTYGWSYLESLDTYREPNVYQKRIYVTPDNWRMTRFLSDVLGKKIKNRIKTLLYQPTPQWFVAVSPKRSFREPPRRSDYKLLVPPKDRFYADPFLHEKGGRTWLFMEDYRYAKSKGLISVCEVDRHGTCSEPRVVLEREYHLSYPFLFEWNDQVYMMPETLGNNTIELYRAVTFPDEWVLDRVLIKDIRAVDATLFEKSGKFWLFTNVGVEGGSTWDELFLFMADSPLGPWKPHPKNPVVSDVRVARPAGKLFYDQGELIRPAQDCSVCYGHAINFRRVKLLSETDYQEETISRVTPEWMPGNMGTHTYNSSEQFQVLDGKIWRRRW
jgi:hypothetical protein